MTLPHEGEVSADIAATFRTELETMEALHRSVVDMMAVGSWTIGKRGAVGFGV